MSTINGISGSPAIQNVVSNPVHRDVEVESSTPRTLNDRVELSGMSHLLQALKANDIRTDKVTAIRQQIEAGTYEDEQKFDVAADRMLDDLTR